MKTFCLTRKSKRIISIVTTVALVLPWVTFPKPAKAANLLNAYLRLDRMTQSVASGGTVCLSASAGGAGTEAYVRVTFPTGFTVNATASNWTVTTTNLPAGGTAMDGVLTATTANAGSRYVQWPINNITDTTNYCFNFTGNTTLTNGSTGTDQQAIIQTLDSGSTEIDRANIALALIASDQVVITATVPPTFSFALGNNAQNLGTLSTSAVTAGSGTSVTLQTNASNGWITWVKSANVALTSVSTSDSIPTSGALGSGPSTLTAGTKGYVLDCDLTTDSATADTGTVTIATEYNGATTSQGGTLSVQFQEVATADGPTDNDVVTLIPRVTISGLTKAASDYTDTYTVVGAAVF